MNRAPAARRFRPGAAEPARRPTATIPLDAGPAGRRGSTIPTGREEGRP